MSRRVIFYICFAWSWLSFLDLALSQEKHSTDRSGSILLYLSRVDFLVVSVSLFFLFTGISLIHLLCSCQQWVEQFILWILVALFFFFFCFLHCHNFSLIFPAFFSDPNSNFWNFYMVGLWIFFPLPFSIALATGTGNVLRSAISKLNISMSSSCRFFRLNAPPTSVYFWIFSSVFKYFFNCTIFIIVNCGKLVCNQNYPL